MDALHPERGSVALGALTKLLVLALIVVVAFDAASIGHTYLQASDQGSTAAVAAADSWVENKDKTLAFHAAEASLAGSGYVLTVTTFRIGTDGTVSFDVRARAKTLLADRLSFSRPWADVVTHVSASFATPGL
jgi:hypothetical protein